MGCRVEHPGMPHARRVDYHSLVLGNPSTMHQEYHSMQAGASYDASLLCKVEPWMHEVEETRPHSISST